MRYDLIKHGKVISNFEDSQLSIVQLIELHKLGYKFEPSKPREAAYCEPLLGISESELTGSELPILLQHQALALA